MELQKLTFVAFLLSILITTQVFADCTCETEEIAGNKSKVLEFKLIALVSILIAGCIGVSLPFAGKVVPALRPEKDGFYVVKAFAAGVILATGFIHILPDAFENLTSPCLKEHPWGDFPFTGFVAMVATIATLLFETLSTAYQQRVQTEIAAKLVGGGRDEENKGGVVGAHMHTRHIHAHGSMLQIDDSEIQRYRIVSQVGNILLPRNFRKILNLMIEKSKKVLCHSLAINFLVLELGIIVHSVIIGLSLGASKSPKTIKPLIFALSFHQFFEGLGLGGCIFQADINSLAVTLMGAFFALTTPGGIVIGILVSNTYEENSPTALIVQGVLNAASSGILIYMALVDLLSPDFKNPRMQNNKILLVVSNVSLLFGAGLMSLLAKWA